MFDEPPPDTSYPEGSEDPLARTPPQDVAAEQNVLGAMLLSKDAIADVLEIIKAEDFYRPNHELIFNAILDLFGRGEPADAVMVAAELDRRGQLEKVGGRVYIADLVGLISVAANAEYYARIVRDKAVLRRLVDASVKISQLGYDGTGEVDDLVDEAQQTIYSITERNSAQDYVSIGELLQSTFDEIEAAKSNMTGVKTGFSDLDDLTNGLHAGQMVIVAARPSMGKSTLALDFARQAAIKNNLATAFFSLEMSKTEIVMRLLSAECTVKLNHIRNGGMTENDWDRLKSKVTDITTAPLFIDDSPNLTMMEIRAKARRLKQHHQ